MLSLKSQKVINMELGTYNLFQTTVRMTISYTKQKELVIELTKNAINKIYDVPNRLLSKGGNRFLILA